MNTDLRNELLDRGLSDMLQLGEMAHVARRHLPAASDERDVVAATLEVITDFLESKYAIVGDVRRDPDDGLLYVHSWALGPTDTAERIEREWLAIGRLEGLGEVCWLELTQNGRLEARRLGLGG
jgi:hypothetical protein